MLQLWSHRKFQNFFILHVSVILGMFFVPLDRWYFYDILIFSLLTWPMLSLILHSYFNHNYVTFRNRFIEVVCLMYISLISYWNFADMKSYHVAHHKYWPTMDDPTAQEIRQGFLKFYIGLTKPCRIEYVKTKPNPIVDFFNQHFYLIKFILISIFVLLSWKMFFHFIVVQQLLFFIASKVIDGLFHINDDEPDKPWLFPIYWNDSWHTEHHTVYDKEVWHWKWINIQYYYSKLLFKN